MAPRTRLIPFLLSAFAVLVPGQVAAAQTQSPPSTATTATNPTVTTNSDEDIFEALRLNITAGAIFFNGDHTLVKTTNDGRTTATVKSSQFSQASTYFALEAQPRLWAWGAPRCRLPKAEGEALKATRKAECNDQKPKRLEDRGFSNFYLEPFVNVRFTTIGVNEAGTVVAPDASALKSDKAAQAQGGVLLSVNFGGFSVNKSQFHWSVAAVGRGAFQLVTDGNRSGRVWNLDDDLYDAFSTGTRVSLYQKDRPKGDETDTNVRSGWSPVAYFEVTYGKFQNFERATAKDGKTEAASCLRDVAQCLARDQLPPVSDYILKSGGRVAFEGRLLLQHLYLGVDINNGDGPDDMRFIGGLTVKLDRFFSRQ